MSNMRTAAIAALIGFSAVGAYAIPPVPRQSPEFVFYLPDGSQKLLSQYKGKVVLLEFLFTTCPHCQHEAGIVTSLYKELGAKGFQPLGVAVNDLKLDKFGAMIVSDFVRNYNVGFPVAIGQRDTALNYMGIAPNDRWVVPQILLIDRKGTIRFQTPAMGSEDVQNEAWLRGKIEELLKEGAGPSAKKTGTASRKKTASIGTSGKFAHH